MTFLEFSRIITNLILANQNRGTNLKTDLGGSKLNKLSTSSISIRLWKWILFSNVQQAWWHLQRTWRKNKLILFFEIFEIFYDVLEFFWNFSKIFKKKIGFLPDFFNSSSWLRIGFNYERNMETVTSVTVSHVKSWNPDVTFQSIRLIHVTFLIDTIS